MEVRFSGSISGLGLRHGQPVTFLVDSTRGRGGWVARLVARDPAERGGVAREFLRAVDPRAQTRRYEVPNGVFEVEYAVARGETARAYVRVTDEAVEAIAREEALAALPERSRALVLTVHLTIDPPQPQSKLVVLSRTEDNARAPFRPVYRALLRQGRVEAGEDTATDLLPAERARALARDLVAAALEQGDRVQLYIDDLAARRRTAAAGAEALTALA